MIAGRLAAAEAGHRQWPLCHVEVFGLDQDLLQHAGLPAPSGDPLAHASRGMPVRIGMWHWRSDASAAPPRRLPGCPDIYPA